MDFDEASGRKFLELPDGYVLPDTDDLMHDARAILLHTVNLRRDTADSGIQVSPIWENREGQASLRATIVPKPVEQRHFEGKGIAALKDAGALQMIADTVEILAEEPAAAALALQSTAELWISEDAPIRSLGVPFKGHFKLLTLVMADFFRKIGAGLSVLEWLTSLGLLSAFHDPAEDPPLDDVRNATREKTGAMCEEEAAWMASIAEA